MDMRRDGPPQRQLRLWAAIGGQACLVRRRLPQPHRQAKTRVADAARHPQLVAGPRPAARRRPARRRAADGGESEAARRAPRSPHRIAAEQGDAETAEHQRESLGKSRIPRRIAQAVADEDADRLRPLGGKVGQVDGDQLPRDVLRRVVGQEVDALDDHVVRQDQPLPLRRIVGQPARGGIGGDSAQARDEFGFAHATLSLDTNGDVRRWFRAHPCRSRRAARWRIPPRGRRKRPWRHRHIR